MIKAAVFDLDGTLLDSSEMWENLPEIYLRTLNITPKPDLSRKLSELSLRESAELVRREYDIPFSAEEMVRQVTHLAEDFYKNEVRLKDGVPRLLTHLQRHCIKMCIATGNDVSLTASALSRLHIEDFFTDIFGCDDYGGKNSPEVYLAAAESLFASPSETVVFEDSLFAVKTAKAAGFTTAAVRDISEKKQDELRQTADYYAENIGDFTDIFCKSRLL